MSGPDPGQAICSTSERVVVGTHPSCDLRLSDRLVSRFHCELSVAFGQIVLRDLNSRNGTRLDDVQVREAFPRWRARISIGESVLQLGEMDRVSLDLHPDAKFANLVGASALMRRVFALLERCAASDATVLLEGETGTGKDAVAEAIHTKSDRHDQPFIVLDCGAIPAELLESELFGHEKGAFTGAITPRDGAFAAASGGTLFLDEIGEMPLGLQSKLLHALEHRGVKRVGSNKYVPVDVRVIAATNRNLREEVNQKRFRSDLYYRLAVIQVKLPPLRERFEDVPALAQHFLDAIEKRSRRPVDTSFLRTPAFFTELHSHQWPGNLRELRNYVERCYALREAVRLEPDGGPEPEPRSQGGGPVVDPSLPLREAREQWIQELERRYLEALLVRHSGNVREAARAAGVDRVYLYRLLWKYDLKRSRGRPEA
ncbi:sigma 54-interacting transcriptional regulator [Polyangium sp. 6x1]|uniref:sigma 54-interacting transcriptional regulator n=1 Tax=Polyangium sp. 6x1 TaxID=3042689 RepID=UPI002482A925|nr:sigma 54-interacting transcriptional regulator [Polyangium sp. 6x1]MDI1451825.1 sigma 54-interacting transcriptional regulator [Polyangium sp. 6x1]